MDTRSCCSSYLKLNGVLLRFAVILNHYANRDVNRRCQLVTNFEGETVLVNPAGYHRFVEFKRSGRSA
jgi:hypothetical protein